MKNRLAMPVWVALLLVLGLVSPGATPAAQAAVIPVTDLTVEVSRLEVTYGWNEPVRTTVRFCTPDAASAGDTFTLRLPSVLGQWPDSLRLTHPDGTPTYDVTISGSPAVATFRLTADGADVSNLCSTAYFGGASGGSPTGRYPLDYVLNGTQTVSAGTLTVIPQVYPVPTTSYKQGWFNAQADQCRIGTENCMTWRFVTKVGPGGTVVIDDPAGDNWRWSCDMMTDTYRDHEVVTYQGGNRTAVGGYSSGAVASLVTAYSCTPTHVHLEFNTASLTGDQSLTVTLTASAVTPGGQGGVTYTNRAQMGVGGPAEQHETQIASTWVGGASTGDRVRITKGDVAGEAADTEATAAQLPTGATTLAFVVTNAGTNPLRDVSVADRLVSGTGRVDALTCDFSPLGGPATGTRWEGPMAPGAEVRCTASLSQVTGTHHDQATVTARGNAEVSDSDDYWAVGPAPVPRVSVGDRVWRDDDRDGRQGVGEPGLGGVTVTLANGGTTRTTTTDDDGRYWFADLEAGSAGTLTFTLPAGYAWTTPDAGGDTSNAPTDATDSDVSPAGTVAFTAPAAGGNRTGADATDNPGLDAGVVQVNLQLAKQLDTTGPVAAGSTVTFTLTPRNTGSSTALAGWSVTEVVPAGLTLTSMTGAGYTCTGLVCTSAAPLAGGATGPAITVTATVDAGFTGEARNVAYVAPAAGEVAETNPLAVPAPATDATATGTDNDASALVAAVSRVSIGDLVWWDVNRNGRQDSGEAPVPGVTVTLTGADGTTKTTTTDAEGRYRFVDLMPSATGTVEFTRPAGTSFTMAAVGADADDSDAAVATGRVEVTAPASGRNSAETPDDPTIDAGLVSYNLTLSKVADVTTVEVGSRVTYTLTPHNDGPTDALASWTVTEVLPAGLTLESMGGDGYSCTGTVCTATRPLAAGADAQPVTVVATVTAAGDLRNVAYVAASSLDVPERNPWDAVPGADPATTSTDNDRDAVVSAHLPGASTPSGTATAGSAATGGRALRDLAATGALVAPWLPAAALGTLLVGLGLVLGQRRLGRR